MRQQQAHLADGTILEFPEGTSGAVIDVAVKKYLRDNPPAQTKAVQQAAPVTAMGAMRTMIEGNPFAQTVIGGAKGAASTLTGIGKLLGAVPQETTLEDLALPFTGGKEVIGEPSNTTQKVGFGAEQVGELFVPGGAVSKAGKAVEVATGASKLPTLAKGAVNLGARAGLEAGAAGAVVAAQTGDPNAAKSAAAIAGAVPVVGKAVEPVAQAVKGFMSQKLAPSMIDRLIRPPNKDLRMGRDPSFEIVKRGIKANSMEGLGSAVKAEKHKVGAEIDAMLKTPAANKHQINIVPLVSGPIDDAIKQAKTVTGNQAVVTRLEAMKKALLQDRFNLQQVPTAVRLKPLETRKLKTEIGDSIAWSEDPIEGTVQRVTQKIYKNLNNEIDVRVPGVRAMNASYANLLTGEKSIANRAATLSKLGSMGLSDKALSVLMGGLTQTATGDLSSAAVVAAVTGAALAGPKSPAMQSRLAAQFGALSPQDKTILAKSVPLIRSLYLSESDGPQR